MSEPVPRRYPPTPLLGVATALWRGDRVLLVRRSVPPNAGTWAMPGGLVELGETLEEAASRELEEETRLVPDRLVFNRFHEIIMRDDGEGVERHFVLAMFAGTSARGLAVAGSDAAATMWATMDELAALPLTRSTERFVRESRGLL